jgi:hypothetical protein
VSVDVSELPAAIIPPSKLGNGIADGTTFFPGNLTSNIFGIMPVSFSNKEGNLAVSIL